MSESNFDTSCCPGGNRETNDAGVDGDVDDSINNSIIRSISSVFILISSGFALSSLLNLQSPEFDFSCLDSFFFSSGLCHQFGSHRKHIVHHHSL